ncbi:MAG: hypothetical protein IH621_05165 [Krumholzibacteria bacterium]|nr:hypothetical protein [Candidatus Krumholzibacteria bacterium]
MRTIILCTALTTLLILPGPALGVEFVSVAGSADCNGWTSDLEIWFREGARSVELSYVVVLTDAAGAELQRYEASEALPVTEGPPVRFTYGGAFAAAPGEGCMVTAEFRLFDWFTDGHNEAVAGFTADPACAPPADDERPAALCTHTAGWWRRHQEQWPVDELTIGGDTWDARTLRHVLSRPAWGNLRLLLARQLIAAKFNALINPGAGMDAAIAAADGFLAENDPFTRNRGRNRWRTWLEEAMAIRELIAPLVEFNALGCSKQPSGPADTADDSGVTDLQLVDKALAGEPIDGIVEEDVSLGALKARFR